MVSAVITTYKRGSDIVKRAVESVVNQTYTDWELTVVDDSPDEWEKRSEVKNLVLGFSQKDSRIRYVAHDRNMGACAARNTGLQHASGEYIAFLDDDDEWRNDKLEIMVRKFDGCGSGVALVYCGGVFVYDSNGKEKKRKTAFEKGKVFDSLITRNFIGGTSFPLIRTSALREIGGFDEKMRSSQDLDVWLRLADKFEVDYVTEPLAIYHCHNGERITRSPESIISGKERKLEKYSEYFKTHKSQYNACTMELAVAYANGNNLRAALRAWFGGVRILPFRVVFNLKSLLRVAKWFCLSAKRS